MSFNLTINQLEILKHAIETFNKTLEDNNIQLMHFEETNVDDGVDIAINTEGHEIKSGISNKKNWPEDAQEITRHMGSILPSNLNIFNVYCGYEWDDFYTPFIVNK